MLTTTSPKKALQASAQAYGVNASYSGGTNTMYIKGTDERVKSFIRVCNLKGKKAYPFSFAQSN